MQNDTDDRTVEITETPARKKWEAPAIVKLDTGEAMIVVGAGIDGIPYSS